MLQLAKESIMQYIAHSAQEEHGNWREPHDLLEHLNGVAKRAATNAAGFGGSEWAHVAAMLHDLGKYQPDWQQYIRKASGYEPEAHIENKGDHPNHSTAGALWACDKYGTAGRVLAYLIAGHHAGLSDWNTENHSLEARLGEDKSRAELVNALKATVPAEVFPDAAWKPDLKNVPGTKNGFALWVRMLFSCLVDADFLDTEAYMDPDKRDSRENWPQLPALHEAFDTYMTAKSSNAEDTTVNRLRADILVQCRTKAQEAPGIFFPHRSHRWWQDAFVHGFRLGACQGAQGEAPHHLCHHADQPLQQATN